MEKKKKRVFIVVLIANGVMNTVVIVSWENTPDNSSVFNNMATCTSSLIICIMLRKSMQKAKYCCLLKSGLVT